MGYYCGLPWRAVGATGSKAQQQEQQQVQQLQQAANVTALASLKTQQQGSRDAMYFKIQKNRHHASDI